MLGTPKITAARPKINTKPTAGLRIPFEPLLLLALEDEGLANGLVPGVIIPAAEAVEVLLCVKSVCDMGHKVSKPNKLTLLTQLLPCLERTLLLAPRSSAVQTLPKPDRIGRRNTRSSIAHS